MVKATKPSFQHAHPTGVRVRPHSNRKNSTRKRMARKTGEYTDSRAEKHGQMRDDKDMTDDRWKKVVAAMANGSTRKDAAEFAGITLQTINAYLISNVAAYKQIRDAQLVWNRRGWDTELIEAVFNDMACGLSLKKSCDKHGITDRYQSLMKIIHSDKQIREVYNNARELWAESFLDDTIDIADDTGKDRLENGRINHEVVNRSKLRIDARWRAMGAMVKKRFGDTKHVEVEGSVTFSHIAMLTGARKRLEKIRPDTAPMKVPVIIDEKTGEVADG